MDRYLSLPAREERTGLLDGRLRAGGLEPHPWTILHGRSVKGDGPMFQTIDQLNAETRDRSDRTLRWVGIFLMMLVVVGGVILVAL